MDPLPGPSGVEGRYCTPRGRLAAGSGTRTPGRALCWYLPGPTATACAKGVPMGCGASMQASSDKPAKRGWFGLTRQPPPAAAAPTRITTPPPEGLRIDANARSAPAMRRQDYGMAATPVGKQAEEYKFFCPLCMMFYRTMREMPCCKQYTQHVERRPGFATARAPLTSLGQLS